MFGSVPLLKYLVLKYLKFFQECGARFHNCKSSEHLMICPKYEVPDEYEWMFRGMSSGRDRSVRLYCFGPAGFS